MARPIWRGAISFGMVTIPVKLYTATESKDISFRQIHDDDCKSRIRQLRWCPVHDREVAYDEIVRGYEYAKDQYVLLDDEDFDHLPLPSKRTVSLTSFVHEDEIDPIYYEKAYYLEPDEIGEKAYALLVKALEEKHLVAIGKVAIRQKERLCALRLVDGGLALETLLFADEIREREGEGIDESSISDEELQMAFSLIEMLEGPFEPEQYQDQYREALTTVIEAKLEGEEVVVSEEPEATNVVDLMAALKASVEATKASKGDSKAKAGGSEEGAKAAKSGASRSRRKAKAS